MDDIEVNKNALARGEPLRGFWYAALPSSQLRRGQMRRQKLLDEPLVLARDKAGKVFALDDHCRHRGIPLSFGNFDGERIECCYHGWQFDLEGQCRHIPALLPDSPVKVDRICVKSYRAAEADGYVWVFMPNLHNHKHDVSEVPRLPVFSEHYRQCIITRRLVCNVDDGVLGLVDPAHGTFVHQSFFWRKRGSIRTKEKKFEPIPNGFRMSTHTPSSNSAAYRILKLSGEPLTTTIDFILPNIRIEQIRCGPYWFTNRTMITPITRDECRMDFVAAWNFFRWVPMTKTVFRLFANAFTAQDQKIMEQQSVGLKDNPPLMFIDDADTQASWYFKLKASYEKSQRNGGSLEHPLKEPVTLRWRT